MNALHYKGLLFLFCTIIISGVFLRLHRCHTFDSDEHNKLNVVCTTTIIADAVRSIAGDKAHVECLMGPGIDPHTYRAREGDVHRMVKADIIFYNGLHLEGRMQDMMKALASTITTVAVTDSLDRSLLRYLYDNIYDPHVWHDVSLWRRCVHFIACTLSTLDHYNADYYHKRALHYDEQLQKLDEYCQCKIGLLPNDQRIVITAHDAFYYCAQRYNFSVMGLQGMSTEAEVTMHDIEETVALIVANKIPTIFIESSVCPRAINAVQEGVMAQGMFVRVGDELYSDSLGHESSDGSTYENMIKHNIDAIFAGLSL
jgi:manganese/zinc/iron transport system substrate-binding protein